MSRPMRRVEAAFALKAACRRMQSALLVLQAMDDGKPMRIDEVAQETGLSLKVARDALYELQATGLAHIRSWVRQIHAPPYPLYLVGHGIDAPRPRATPKAEISRNWRARRRVARANKLAGPMFATLLLRSEWRGRSKLDEAQE